MNVFTRMAARIRGSGKRGDFAGRLADKNLCMVYQARMQESKKLSERLFKGRTVHSVSKHANDDGVTLLFIDGTRGDIEACDAVEILKYLD